jgi:hypothetical protein
MSERMVGLLPLLLDENTESGVGQIGQKQIANSNWQISQTLPLMNADYHGVSLMAHNRAEVRWKLRVYSRIRVHPRQSAVGSVLSFTLTPVVQILLPRYQRTLFDFSRRAHDVFA